MRLVVFGSINLDTTLDVLDLPTVGETVLAERSSTAAGGKGANQAVAARRFGAPVSMVGCVGADPQAQYMRAALESDGVDCRLRVVPSRSTGAAVVFRWQSGDNAIVVAPGANAEALASDLERFDWADEPTVLVMQLEVPVHEVELASRYAHDHGWKVVLNSAPVPGNPGLQLESVDTIIANEVEAAALTGLRIVDRRTALAAAVALRRLGPRVAVVTLGADGAVLAEDGAGWAANCPVVPVLDTTGAGDALVGTYAAAELEGLPPAEALRAAVAAGSLAVTGLGAQPSFAGRDRVLALARDVVVSKLAGGQ